MERTCDCCPEPAVVHETLVRDGVKTEVHLCAAHAQERGYVLPTAAGPALVVPEAEEAEGLQEIITVLETRLMVQHQVHLLAEV